MNRYLDVPIVKLSECARTSAPLRSNAEECRSLLEKLKFLWALGLLKIETAEKMKKDNAARIKLFVDQRRALIAKLKWLKPKFELYTGKPLVRAIPKQKGNTVKRRLATTCPRSKQRSPVKVASREGLSRRSKMLLAACRGLSINLCKLRSIKSGPPCSCNSDGLNVIPFRADNTETGDAVTVDLYRMNNDEIQKYLPSSKI